VRGVPILWGDAKNGGEEGGIPDFFGGQGGGGGVPLGQAGG